MHPVAVAYLSCRLLASWHLAMARVWMQAAGDLGPLPQAHIVRLHRA